MRRRDLVDQVSVHTFADESLGSGRGIDILIHSTGLTALPETRLGDATRHQPSPTFGKRPQRSRKETHV